LTALLAAVFAASLLGSLHCVGMCGPLVAVAVGLDGSGTGSRSALHVAYHGGRLVSYLLLGAVGGGLGAGFDSGVSGLGLQRAATLLAGITMAVIGLVGFFRAVGIRLPAPPAPGPVLRWITALQRAALGLRPLPRAAAVGLGSGLLPCGWLYAFAVTAFGTAGPFMGASVMAAFWAGTVPALLVVGAGVQALTGTLGRRVPILTSLVILAIGLYTIAGRTTLRLEQVGGPQAGGAVLEATPPPPDAPASSDGR
jgi:sulfite exporter TauE/SafE